MAIMTTGLFPSMFYTGLANLKLAYGMEEPRWPSEYTQYYNVGTMDAAFINHLLYAGPGHPTEVQELEDLPLVSLRETYTKRFDTRKYGFRLQFSQETVEEVDKRIRIFSDSGRGLRRQMDIHDEILGVDLLENGDTGTAAEYLVADGQNIFDASHPIGEGAVMTDSNLLTAATLAITSLQTLNDAVEQTADDNGDLMMLRMERLFIHQAQQYTAMRLLAQLETDPESAERAAHPLKAVAPQTIILRYLLTSGAYYGDTSYASSEQGWNWLWMRPLQIQEDINIINESAYVTASKKLARGVSDWRGRVKVPAV